MARAREVPDLDCEEPFALAAARVIDVRAAEVVEQSERVLDVDEIERVHDMRVATRRLRATLEFFRPCFPRKRFQAALKQVKSLADALGERRDADVSIDALERFSDEVGDCDRRGVALLIGQLRREQQVANDCLRPFVTTQRLRRLRADLRNLADAARDSAAGDAKESRS